MEQLSGLDAAFVHQDSPRTPMHVSAVLIYNATRHRLSLESLRQHIRTRPWSERLFQRKLQRVSFDVDAPYWVPAGKTNWDYHLQERALSGTDRWQTFHNLLEQEHSQPMDLTRPLWQLRLVNGINNIPGLPDECQGLILKAHHAAIDGISLARLLQLLQDGTADSPPSNTPETTVSPQPWEVWSRAGINSFNRQIKFAEVTQRLINNLPRARDERRNKKELVPTLGSRSHFNDRVSPGRTVGLVLIPREKMLAIKRGIRGVTHNDVAAAVIAGGLRLYLEGHNKLPGKSLVAGMPINLRTASSDVKGSNQIATMAVGLATSVDDPIARVKMIHSFALAGKREIKALGTGTVMDISDSMPPTILADGIRTLAWASKLTGIPVPFHTMISNVPGPVGDNSIDGLPLVSCAGLGPVRDNMGLFHIISTTEQTVSLSFNACANLLPDGETYRNCLEASFSELFSAVLT